MSSFRARARTVDLLGRQQIAGIPTAISELFKNAHDAYAQNVEVDFFRIEQLFVLRDDGLGMDPQDFQDRWLTLGTESKLADPRGIKLPSSLAGEPRPVLGEKGIGRLAIASIGSQVLVLTRPRLGRERPLTVALVNWRLFEVPGIDLTDVMVPVEHRTDGSLPDARALKTMAGSIRRSLTRLGVTDDERAAIDEDLSALDFDPAALLASLRRPSLTGKGHGTHFIIVPTREQLAADIDGAQDADEDVAPPLVKTLIGFANTMTPDAPEPRIHTAFRDRRTADDVLDIIEANEFFTPADFGAADHHIDGWFDATGHFSGTVDVYGKGPEPYELAFTGAGGAELDCGSFRFRLAYVQGRPNESRLDLATYGRVSQKLDRIGGLYIYRDGIRVLPYGNPDFDFLQIELRRSRNIGRYFFSYRRMFGVVELDSDHNADLREKAGREGFRDNRAYRQFRDVLRHFLKQVAATYFAPRGEQSDRFVTGRTEAKRRFEQRQSREKEALRARRRFTSRVGEVLAALADKRPDTEALDVVVALRSRLATLLESGRAGADALLAAELEAERSLAAVRSRYSLAAPAGFGLTPDLRRDWDYLNDQLNGLETDVFARAARGIAEAIGQAREEAAAGPDRQQRLRMLVQRAIDDAGRRTSESADQARKAAHLAEQVVEDAAQHSLKVVGSASEEALASAGKRSAIASDAIFVEQRLALERQLSMTAEHESEALLALAERLRRAATFNGNGHGRLSEAELTALLEEEVLELRERADRDFELAQLGMATQVITHELDTAVTEVRNGLRRLGAWADVNDGLRDVYSDIRTAFDHLDGYLSLFTPLQRRLRRRRERVTGTGIRTFLDRLFGRRLEGLSIELRTTEAFQEWHATAFRSGLYPAFINLVDNATYWVRQSSPPYWIKLDADGDALIVSDSGPGVPERDREVIWDYGFSRKPGGRGAGLHITREVLTREGWSIEAVSSPDGNGAAFEIRPPTGDE